MKNKSLKKILFLLTIFVASSCDMYSSSTLPHLNGVQFNQLTKFVYNDTTYSISIPSTDESFYLYKQSDRYTECKSWTLNYSFDIYYIPNDELTIDNELFNTIHSKLNSNIDAINRLLGNSTTLYKHGEKIEIETTLDNEFNSKVTFMYFDKFLPIRLTNEDDRYSYTISLPINRQHLLMDETNIENPFEEGTITLQTFYSLPKIIHNDIY